MNVVESGLGGVLVSEPVVHGNHRGFFFESYREDLFRRAAGTSRPFVRDNHSRSVRHVLRGLHYQVRQPQGTLVRVVGGEVLDVVVDLRRQSPTFGRWMGTILSAENKRQPWVPEGFAPGTVSSARGSSTAIRIPLSSSTAGVIGRITTAT